MDISKIISKHIQVKFCQKKNNNVYLFTSLTFSFLNFKKNLNEKSTE